MSWTGPWSLRALEKRVLLTIAVLVEDFSDKTSAGTRGRGYYSSTVTDI